jgi:hypothetical protein
MSNKEEQSKQKSTSRPKSPTKKLSVGKKETTEDIVNKAVRACEDKWQLQFKSFEEKLTESTSKEIETALSAQDGLSSQINKLHTAIQALGTSSDPDHPSVMDLPRALANKIDPLVTQGKSYIKGKELKAHENEKRLVSEQKENLSQLKANLIEIKSQHDLNLEKEKELAKEKEATDNLIKDNTETMKKCEDLLHHIMTHLTDQSDISPKIDLESLTKQVDEKIEEEIKKVKEVQPKPNHIEDIFTEDFLWYSLTPSDTKKDLPFHLVNKTQFYHKASLDDIERVNFVSRKNGKIVELDPRNLDIEGQTALMDYIDYLNAEKSS